MAINRRPPARRIRQALAGRRDEALSPVTPTLLADEITERLLEYIRENDLKPGSPFPSQRELAARLTVSRPVLRQAIRQLELEGILRVRHGSGMWLASVPDRDAGRPARSEPAPAAEFSHESALALLDARMVIDVELAARAAERATPADLAALEQALTRIRTAALSGQPTVSATSRFHRLLAESAHSAVLAGFYAELTKPMLAGGLRIESTLPDVTHHEEENHRALLDAVRSRDPDVARAAMRTHLRQAHRWEQRVEQLRSTGGAEIEAMSGEAHAADVQITPSSPGLLPRPGAPTDDPR